MGDAISLESGSREWGKGKRLIDGVETIRVASSGIFGGIFRKEWISYCQKPIRLVMIEEAETDVAGHGGSYTGRRREREQYADSAQASLRS
jgi:hypothetical protein